MAQTRRVKTQRSEAPSFDVTVQKVVGTVTYGNSGYKLVNPDGSERALGSFEAAFLLVAGWDESGVFRWTDPEGFTYEVSVDRTSPAIDEQRQYGHEVGA